MDLAAGAFPLAFAIVAIEPGSMATQEMYRNQGPPMGAGTVGLQFADEILIGSFAGDRVLRVSLLSRSPEP